MPVHPNSRPHRSPVPQHPTEQNVTEILETGSNDVFVVKPHGDPGKSGSSTSEMKKNASDILIPVLDGVIVNVDSQAGVMTIDPPEGLF